MLMEGIPMALATAGFFSVATERKVFASRELSELAGEDAGCSCIHVPTAVHGQEARLGRAEQRQERDLLCSGPIALSPIPWTSQLGEQVNALVCSSCSGLGFTH